MQSSHAATAVDVAFDDPNLIADAGLVPVVALAEQVGVPDLGTEHLTITGAANGAGAKFYSADVVATAARYDAAVSLTTGANPSVRRRPPVFVTSPFHTLQAESQHRGHAIVEQVIADAAGSALAHLPSGSFQANAAWAVLWAIAHNLTRAAGVLAGVFHARATTATIRAHLINIPARLARSARRLTLHLPERWPWQPAWESLHAAIHRPPPRTSWT